MTPFVKWAGGKAQLLKRIEARLPDDFNCYFEPFVGGGALFLSLHPESAVINDNNHQLMNVYRQLKHDADAVIQAINLLDSKPCDKERYYELRERFNEKIVGGILDVECAALLIWINKHCFNGLYRVNAKGLFNVPYNNRVNGKSINEDNLRAIGRYLKDNEIVLMEEDFVSACDKVKEGDFVYFDSPYIPVSETAYFTDYTKDGFSYSDHKRLAELFRMLDARGAKLMLSNHDVPLAYELYEGFTITKANVNRAINSDAKKRTGKEVIITNY